MAKREVLIKFDQLTAKYGQILNEFCQQTTSHGIPNIVRATYRPLKIMWIIFFLLATSVSIYLAISSIGNYLDYEVVTKISVVTQQPAEFPTITICNRNAIFSFIDKNTSDAIIENITNLPFINKQIYFQQLAFNFSQVNNKSIGVPLRDFIIDCYFNQMVCDYENDFLETYYFFYGQCYIFNLGKNSTGHNVGIKKVYDEGAYNGLRLKVFTGDPELSFSSESVGLHVMIHNSTIRPSNFEGFEVPTGLETNVAVNRLFNFKKENPYSECVTDIQNYIPDFMSPYFKANYMYRRNDCLHLCLQSLLIKEFGCYQPIFDKLNSSNPCISADQTIKGKEFFYKEYIERYQDSYCKPKCPLGCDSVNYNSFISHGSFPTPFYMNSRVLNYSDAETFKKSIVSLNIYYDSFSYTIIKELAKMDIYDLISGIGGTLGLFIGISILSVVEIFEVIFLLIKAFFKRDEVSLY